MSIKCLFGHKWNGCKCSQCGKVRNEQHDWDLCKGRCKRCGKRQVEQHEWNGCKCLSCGKVRDEQHNWNGCKCSCCGKVRDEQHEWNGCKCLRCGKEVDWTHHKWGAWRDFRPEEEYGHYSIPLENHVRECSVCGKKDTENHKWNFCICVVCGKRRPFFERGFAHDWKPVLGKCEEICDVCGEIQTKSHSWERVPGTCGRKCSICGCVEEHYAYHEWERVPDSCTTMKCRICGKTEERANHLFESIGNCRKKCSVCGRTEYDHDYKGYNQNYDHESADYKCTKCGHMARDNGWGTDTRQNGVVAS